MEIWYNVIVFSKETLVHYYHKYVKAGVSPVSNSKCASGNRALNFLGTFREVSQKLCVWVLFQFFLGNFLKSVRVGMYSPNYSKKQCFFHHHFYLLKIIYQSKMAMEYCRSTEQASIMHCRYENSLLSTQQSFWTCISTSGK